MMRMLILFFVLTALMFGQMKVCEVNPSTGVILTYAGGAQKCITLNVAEETAFRTYRQSLTSGNPPTPIYAGNWQMFKKHMQALLEVAVKFSPTPTLATKKATYDAAKAAYEAELAAINPPPEP